MIKKLLLTSLCGILIFGITNASASHLIVRNSKDTALIGRWDITIKENGKPSWLEVKRSGTRTLVGRFVSMSGSARPVSKINFDDGQFSFSIPPQWEAGNQDLVVKGKLTRQGIQGTMMTPEGQRLNWTGVKAPYLIRSEKPEWGKSIQLFNGKNLSGWKASGENQWEVKDNLLTNPRAGANLISEAAFTDFKLHVEFRYPKGSNSGIYLRGRYEVQIEDSPKGAHPESILYSGVYGFLPPAEIASLGPDRWQTYDITLVGRMITIIANGKEVICNQEIPGITGGALDSREGEPGPIYIQGDHGAIEFKKIVITPAL